MPETLPVWGRDINNRQFIAALADIGDDVDTRWPDLRDQEVFDDLFDELIAGQDSTIDYLVVRLAVYVKCLEFMRRFQDKKCPEHIKVLKRVVDVEVHSREILSVIWHTFQRMKPFADTTMVEEWRIVSQEYVKALFLLQHEPYFVSTDFFSKLCIISYAPNVATHCWLFAPPEARRQACAVRDLIIEAVGRDCLTTTLTYYYETELGKQISLTQAQQVLRGANKDDDSIQAIIQDFDAYMSSFADSEMWNLILASYLHFLQTLATADPYFFRKALDGFQNLNNILHHYLEQKHASRIHTMRDIFSNFPGAEVMSAIIVQSAHAFQISSVLPTQVFLVSILLDTLGSPKDRTTAQLDLISLLSSSLAPHWFSTFETLRSLEDQLAPQCITKTTGISVVLRQWCLLGSILGVHALVSAGVQRASEETGKPKVSPRQTLEGCCAPKCYWFLRASKQEVGLCTMCRKAQYCSEKCQRRDWDEHRRICTKVASA